MSPHSTIPFPSRHRAQVARAAGLALLAAVAVCLIAGAVLAFRSGSVEPGWEPDAAFAWTMLWLPAGCRLAVPALLLLACACAAPPAREGQRGRAWRVGIALAAFSAVRLVLQGFAMASFANSGGANAALFGSSAAALLHWWFTGLAYPLSEAAIILAGFCLPGIPAEDPATLAKDGAGRREWWFFSASAACLALLLVFNILRSVHLKRRFRSPRASRSASSPAGRPAASGGGSIRQPPSCCCSGAEPASLSATHCHQCNGTGFRPYRPCCATCSTMRGPSGSAPLFAPGTNPSTPSAPRGRGAAAAHRGAAFPNSPPRRIHHSSFIIQP